MLGFAQGSDNGTGSDRAQSNLMLAYHYTSALCLPHALYDSVTHECLPIDSFHRNRDSGNSMHGPFGVGTSEAANHINEAGLGTDLNSGAR